MNKNIIALLLAAGMLSASAAAFAENAPASASEDVVVTSQVTESAETPYTDTVIKSVSDKELTAESGTYSVSDKTLVFDNTGKEIKLADLKADDKVFVVSKDGKTAEIVVLQVEDSVNSITVDTFVKSDSFGYVVNSSNDLALNLDENSVIVDTEGKALKAEDTVGKKLLVFCGVVTMSMPGQTYPDKVVVLGDGEAAEDKAESAVKTANFYAGEEENSYTAGDNSLVIFVGEKTEVVDADGKAYTGSLDKKNLTVSYTVETRSIPPQTTPEKIVVNGDEVTSTTLTDTFFKSEDEEGAYISSDNKLLIFVGEETKVTDKDGKAYTGSLDNKDLTVTYTYSTMSIPAQTTPETIVVEGEGTKTQAPVPTLEPVATAPADVKNAEAGNFKSEVKKTVDGIVLLPVRGICEALGIKVDWDGEKSQVELTGKTSTVSFIVNSDSFDAEDGKSAKAQIIEDRTYAPSGLFSKLGLKLNQNDDTVVVSE